MKRLILFILILMIQSCETKPDLESARTELLALHNEQRKAHMERNVNILIKDSAIDYIEVNKGAIRRPTYAESLKRFQSYFDAVEFIKWDDVSPPIFSFSDDATMATSIVEKLVITKLKGQGNKMDTAHYAWLAVYKKTDGKWQMHRMGSTNK